MHLRSAPLAVAVLLAASVAAGAQVNHNLPQSQASTQTHINRPVAQYNCLSDYDVGTTASSTISSFMQCNASYAGGVHTLQAGTSTANAVFGASAYATGTFNQFTSAQAQALVYGWNFYTISNPANIFRITLTTTLTSDATISGNPYDNARAGGIIAVASIIPTTGSILAVRGSVERQSGAGQSSQFDNTTRTCIAAVCSTVTTASNTMSIGLFGSDLNSNGVFGAMLQAAATSGTGNDLANTVTADIDAYAYFTAPTVTLYDIDGNDVTDQHIITQDIIIPEEVVVATPEPASVVLLATGLVGVFGIARRRRNAA